MDVTYAIGKVYVTERNDVIKRHGNVIITWWMSAIIVTALKKSTFRNESCARKRIHHGCEGQIEKFSRQQIYDLFFYYYYFQKIGFDMTFMKFQILFSGKKNKKNISECRLLKFFPEC